jgi:hypothetical protein
VVQASSPPQSCFLASAPSPAAPPPSHGRRWAPSSPRPELPSCGFLSYSISQARLFPLLPCAPLSARSWPAHLHGRRSSLLTWCSDLAQSSSSSVTYGARPPLHSLLRSSPSPMAPSSDCALLPALGVPAMAGWTCFLACARVAPSTLADSSSPSATVPGRRSDDRTRSYSCIFSPASVAVHCARPLVSKLPSRPPSLISSSAPSCSSRTRPRRPWHVVTARTGCAGRCASPSAARSSSSRPTSPPCLATPRSPSLAFSHLPCAPPCSPVHRPPARRCATSVTAASCMLRSPGHHLCS